MILGLDVGGTQTDAVLIDQGRVVADAKTVNRADLLETLDLALDAILENVDDPGQIQRMVFSTTMATNAIVLNQMDPAGMIVSAGPGMNPEWFAVGESYHVVKGCMDHRGQEVKPINKADVLGAAATMNKAGIRFCGVACKFSVRNPLHELQAHDWLAEDFNYLALGHRFSGSLNFPRRINTAYLNAALYGTHDRFASALQRTLSQKKLRAPQYLMKPDGGTVALGRSYRFPAQTAQSGPSASIMGALALDGCPANTLVLDIGGTTTDMGLFHEGVPIVIPRGIRLGDYRTNIRSLMTRSIGVGGDSHLAVTDRGELAIGPLRVGSPMAFGGPEPTPTDALVAAGLMDSGDRAKAAEAMKMIAGPLGIPSENCPERILTDMAQGLARAARDFTDWVNSRPVYTIHEVLEGIQVKPTRVVVLGGPAEHLAPYLEKAFGLAVVSPPHSAVANAVGAAAARVTTEINLQADTQRGTVVIPEAGLENPIRRDYTMDEALALGRDVLLKKAMDDGAHTDQFSVAVTEKEDFNMIRGGMRAGKNIRLRLSLVPGIIPEWAGKEVEC